VAIGGNSALAGTYELFKLGVPLAGVHRQRPIIAIGVDAALNTIARRLGA
jgi:hypothetical protein